MEPVVPEPENETDNVTHVVEVNIQDLDPFLNVADAAMRVVKKAQKEGSIDRHDEDMLILYESLRNLLPDDEEYGDE